MTIALHDRRASTTTFSALVRLLVDLSDGLASAWREHRQSKIFQKVDPATLDDIGFSADYVRMEWQSFAEDHPSLVARAACIRSATSAQS
jgi:hypothetical protein